MAKQKSKKGSYIETMVSEKREVGPSGKNAKKMLQGKKCDDCGESESKCEC